MVAPRLFCDICDEFDLHDTDDCPKQASDVPSPPSTPRVARAQAPPPRSYCDNCEGKSEIYFYTSRKQQSIVNNNYCVIVFQIPHKKR